MIWLVIKLLIELRKSDKVHCRIIQKKIIKEHDKEISKERYKSPEERENYWGSKISIIV